MSNLQVGRVTGWPHPTLFMTTTNRNVCVSLNDNGHYYGTIILIYTIILHYVL
jgi:hypothetical protein